MVPPPEVIGGGGLAMGDSFLGTTTVVLVTVEGALEGADGEKLESVRE